MQYLITYDTKPIPWNKGKITGRKPPLKRDEIWAIRVRLQIRVRDVTQASQVASRAIVMQRVTKCPVRFEMTDQAVRQAGEDVGS